MNEDDLKTDVWFHLIEDHGLSVDALHGNPTLMHAAAHAFGIAGHVHEWSDGGER